MNNHHLLRKTFHWKILILKGFLGMPIGREEKQSAREQTIGLCPENDEWKNFYIHLSQKFNANYTYPESQNYIEGNAINKGRKIKKQEELYEQGENIIEQTRPETVFKVDIRPFFLLSTFADMCFLFSRKKRVFGHRCGICHMSNVKAFLYFW